MKNWKNIYTDNRAHMITGAVHMWQPILLYPELLDIFFHDLSRLLGYWRIKALGYVIMPEHFHAILHSKEGANIRKFLHGFRRSVSGGARKVIETGRPELIKYCIKNGINIGLFHERTAGKSDFRFWKGKPRVPAIDCREDIYQKLNYIHYNPVRRGLVESPDKWEYSSYGYYYLGKSSAILKAPQVAKTRLLRDVARPWAGRFHPERSV